MISIITPIYDINAHLNDFLSSMSSLMDKEGKKIVQEIILINNNPRKKISDKKLQDAQKIDNLRIIQNKKNIGYGAACNQGIRMAQGKYTLILNPDVKIDSNALKRMADFLEKNKDANIVSCRLHNSDGSLQHSCKRFPTLSVLIARRVSFPFAYLFKRNLSRYEMREYDHKLPRRVDWVSGALMLMRRKYFFDEKYFMYFEDVDLCRQVKNIYYYPLVFAIHKSERASRRDFRLFFHHLSSMVYYLYKFSFKKKSGSR
jgi:N-acetylglucosaminyl-diphospho-decaprenol L-rhamnosyltransferase